MNEFQVSVLHACEEWTKAHDGLLNASYFVYPETEHANLIIGIDYPRSATGLHRRTHYSLTVSGAEKYIEISPPMVREHFPMAAPFARFILDRFEVDIQNTYALETLRKIVEISSRPSYLAALQRSSISAQSQNSK